MIDIVRRHIVPAAYTVLPPAMATPEATALLMSIGWQESRFTNRIQVKGPARGFFQFEQNGGVAGVLSHAKTKDIARSAMKQLGYRFEPTPYGCYTAIEHNDVLAVVFARLLLWTLPGILPTQSEPAEGWRLYTHGWRPGKPHFDSWDEAWKHGWAA